MRLNRQDTQTLFPDRHSGVEEAALPVMLCRGRYGEAGFMLRNNPRRRSMFHKWFDSLRGPLVSCIDANRADGHAAKAFILKSDERSLIKAQELRIHNHGLLLLRRRRCIFSDESNGAADSEGL